MKNALHKLLALLLVCGMVAGVLAGCSTTKKGATPESPDSAEDPGSTEAPAQSEELLDTFTFISTEPNTLNLLESQSNLDTYVFYLTSAMLFRSINDEVVPELCEKMEVSEDGLTYTYTIKDAKYTDGTPILAEDFVYYFLHTPNGLNAENCAYYVGGEDTYNNGLDTCEGIYAVDEKTFVIQLTTTLATFDGKLEIFPLQKAFVEQKGDALGGTPEDLQYSGPYVLTDWVVGSSMTFKKNPDYISAAELFPVENVKLVVASDDSTIYSMYQNGEVDAVVSVRDDLLEMLGEDKCSIYPAGNLYGIEYNTTGFTYSEGDGFTSRGEDVTALMQNLNFRKALAYAIDREALVAAIDAASVATNRYMSSRVKGTTDDKAYIDEFPLTDVAPLAGDVEAAKQYLADALEELGYGDVSELPKLTFLTFDSVKQKEMATTIISLWKSELGLTNIEVDLQPIQSAIMAMVYMNYDLYLQQLTLDPVNYTDLLAYWETTGTVSDVAGFQQSGVPPMMASMHANEEYDALVSALYTNTDRAACLAQIAEAEQMLYSDFAYFPIMEGNGYQAVQSYVEGFVNPYVENGYGLANLKVHAH